MFIGTKPKEILIPKIIMILNENDNLMVENKKIEIGRFLLKKSCTYVLVINVHVFKFFSPISKNVI